MMPDPKQNENAFRLEEYKALRREIEIYTQESRALERYTIVALGVSWAWLIINKVHDWLPRSIPPLLIVAGGLRGLGVLAHLRQIGAYLAHVEKHFGVTGWEQANPGSKVSRTTAVLGWGLLLVSIIGLLSRNALVMK